jgi:hypothetical protein
VFLSPAGHPQLQGYTVAKDIGHCKKNKTGIIPNQLILNINAPRRRR